MSTLRESWGGLGKDDPKAAKGIEDVVLAMPGGSEALVGGSGSFKPEDYGI